VGLRLVALCLIAESWLRVKYFSSFILAREQRGLRIYVPSPKARSFCENASQSIIAILLSPWGAGDRTWHFVPVNHFTGRYDALHQAKEYNLA
jgi:hypothetical protein